MAPLQYVNQLILINEVLCWLDTAEWLTVANNAKKYGITQQVVINRINRGIIPAYCITPYQKSITSE